MIYKKYYKLNIIFFVFIFFYSNFGFAKLDCAGFEQKHNQSFTLYQKANEDYLSGNSILTDEQYDALFLSLKNYVHCFDKKKLPKKTSSNLIYHKYPMKSLDKLYSKDDIKNFVSLYPNEIWHLEPKFDGVALSLFYVNKLLKNILTRADGEKSKNIVLIANQIKSIPKKVNFKNQAIIRGELVAKKSCFINYKKNYKTPRDLTAAFISTKIKKNNLAKCLDFYPYFADFKKNQDQTLDFLSKNSFLDTNKFSKKIYFSFSELEKFQLKLKKLNYPTDGVVLKLNNFKYHKLAKGNPKFAKAIKPPIKSKIVTVEKIIFKESRLGKISPLIFFDEFEYNNKKFKKIYLYNYAFLNKHQIKINDIVELKLTESSILFHQNLSFKENSVSYSKDKKLTNCFNNKGVCKDRFYLQLQHSLKQINIKTNIIWLKKIAKENNLNSFSDFFTKNIKSKTSIDRQKMKLIKLKILSLKEKNSTKEILEFLALANLSKKNIIALEKINPKLSELLNISKPYEENKNLLFIKNKMKKSDLNFLL